MNINRHNYEEFFLLYIDNELSISDKKLVDDFLVNNPDLMEEFNSLNQVVLLDDTLEFSDKFNLYKTETPISAEEEKLLLLLDNELAEKDALSVSTAIAQNDHLQKNWNELQQTVLDKNEVMVFEDKASLYRKEPSRVIYARFTRWAVAAMLIGFGVYGLFNTTSNEEIPSTGTLAQIDNRQKITIESKDNANNSVIAHANEIANSQQQNDLAQINNAKDVTDYNTSTQNNNHSSTIARTAAQVSGAPKTSTTNNQTATQAQFAHNNTTDQTLNAATVLTATKKTIEPEKIENYIAAAPKKKVEIIDVDVRETPSNSYAIHASNSDEPNDKILYIDEEEVSKTKAAGLLRKLKRTIERKTKINTGDGNGLKIAGFEIALK